MAPRKRKAEEEAAATPTRMATRATEAANRRQTRSSTKGSSDAKLRVTPPARNKPAKDVAARKKERKRSEKKKEENADVAQEEEAEVKSGGEEEVKVEGGAEEAKKKTIMVERCTQCNSFKTRAEQVKAGLENLPGVAVTINPVKPRRGCFEIREEGGETFISLLDMKRPFKPMKDLNMQEVIDNIIQKIQCMR